MKILDYAKPAFEKAVKALEEAYKTQEEFEKIIGLTSASVDEIEAISKFLDNEVRKRKVSNSHYAAEQIVEDAQGIMWALQDRQN